MAYNVFESEMNLIKVDYASSTIKYIGFAPNGAADDDEVWKVTKETLNSDGNMIMSQTYKTFAAWEDRADLEY